MPPTKTDIKEMEEGFKSLQEYSDSQFHTINELNKTITKLQSENAALQKMLEGNLPSLEYKNGSLGISNEQLICETQLCILKDRAMVKELNSDEARRFATYVDVLEKIRKNQTDQDMSVKKLSDADILKMVIGNESETK